MLTESRKYGFPKKKRVNRLDRLGGEKMKQRFSIARNAGGEKIVIKEYAELDKGAFSLLCEESYELETIKSAFDKGPSQVLALLRTESFFPTSYFAEKLIVNLTDYIKQGGSEPVKIDVDDSECISNSSKAAAEGDNGGGIDVLLEVDSEDIIADDGVVGKLDAPIKIAEDETVEISNSL